MQIVIFLSMFFLFFCVQLVSVLFGRWLLLLSLLIKTELKMRQSYVEIKLVWVRAQICVWIFVIKHTHFAVKIITQLQQQSRSQRTTYICAYWRMPQQNPHQPHGEKKKKHLADIVVVQNKLYRRYTTPPWCFYYKYNGPKIHNTKIYVKFITV